MTQELFGALGRRRWGGMVGIRKGQGWTQRKQKKNWQDFRMEGFGRGSEISNVSTEKIMQNEASWFQEEEENWIKHTEFLVV